MAAAQFLWRGLSVSDLDRSTRFFAQALGFEPEGPEQRSKGEWLSRQTGLPDAALKSRLVRNDQGVAFLLYQMLEPAPAGSRERRPNNQYGLTHLAFYVDDIDRWAGKVKAAGGFVHEHTRATFKENGVTMMYCTQPDGIRIELMFAPGVASRFSHSGICMPDTERFMAFYARLGFAEAENFELTQHQYFMDLINELPDVKLRAQMIRNAKGDTIELLKMYSPPAFGPAEPLPFNRLGFTYLAFAADDLDAVAQSLKAAGGRVLEETRAVADGTQSLCCTDPIGVRLVLTAKA